MHQMREPHVRPQPAVIRQPVHRAAPVLRQREVHVGAILGQVRVQPQPPRAGRLRDLGQLPRFDVEGGRRRRHRHPRHRIGRRVVPAIRRGHAPAKEPVQRLHGRRRQRGIVEHPGPRRPPPRQHEPQAHAGGLVEQHLGRVEAVAVGPDVMVIADGRTPRQRQFRQPHAGRHPERRLVVVRPPGERHPHQPGIQAHIHPVGDRLQKRLEQVVVRVHEARTDQRIGRIHHPLARFWPQVAHCDNPPIAHPQGAREPLALAQRPGQPMGDAGDQHPGHALPLGSDHGKNTRCASATD